MQRYTEYVRMTSRDREVNERDRETEIGIEKDRDKETWRKEVEK